MAELRQSSRRATDRVSSELPVALKPSVFSLITPLPKLQTPLSVPKLNLKCCTLHQDRVVVIHTCLSQNQRLCLSYSLSRLVCLTNWSRSSFFPLQIWFYTNDIFENAGIPTPEIPYTTVGTGVIEIIAGLLGVRQAFLNLI